MLYVDTSVFIPFLIREPASPSVERWFAQAAPNALALSSWTIAEFVSAVGNKVRACSLTHTTGTSVIRQFLSIAHKSLRLIEPTAADFAKAAILMEQFDLALRAGDALHVAIAQNANAASLVTLDKTLARAAGQLGLSCEVPA
jgi:predicted nucleic acid-binding protein